MQVSQLKILKELDHPNSRIEMVENDMVSTLTHFSI